MAQLGDSGTPAPERGRKPKKALTARQVETAGPGKHFDGNGLFLRVAETGGRQWVQRITVRGKRVEIGLGSPPVVTLADARALALTNKRLALRGLDPSEEKEKAAEAERQREAAKLTFGDAVTQYLAVKLEGFRNEKHKLQWKATLETYANPVLGKMAVCDIRTKDVLRVLQPIWTTKTVTATRVRQRIEAVLAWSKAQGYREGDNPAAWRNDLKYLLPEPGKVADKDNQPALALGDVSRWWCDLSGRDGMAARALQFLALTAARSGEVRGMTWAEVTITPADNPARTGLWTVPASRMKNGREHRVPLTAEAVALLDALPRMKDSPYVFFAPRGGQLSDMSISAVMRRMQDAKTDAGEVGYLDPRNGRPAVPHGLRSTFRQWAAETGYPRDMSELALAHFIGSEVERAYQRSDMLERRRAMLEHWGRFIRGEDAGGVVVPFAREA